MKKSSQIYLILVLIVVSVFGYLLLSNKNTATPKSGTSMPLEVTDSTTSVDSNSESGYLAFNSQDFENNKTKRRVLFFYAGWCTTCRPVNAQFLENTNKIPEDVVVFRVNFRDLDTDDSEKALAEKYKITYQHTFVQVNQQGEEIKKWNGGNLADLIKNVN